MLEMLIAVSVLTLGISAVIMLVFANQRLRLESGTSGEALYKAKTGLENARASSTVDFIGIVSTATTTDAIYAKKLDVANFTACRKEITSNITWSTEKMRAQKIELKTDVTDTAGSLALGGDCATDPSVGGWTAPTTLGSLDPGTGKATGIDVMNKIVFLSTEDPSPAKEDFFVIDATDGQNPVTLAAINTGPSLNAVDAARDPATGKLFAYVANNATSSQLQIIDATVLTSPTLIGTADLQPAPLGTNSEGRSIFYYDKKVYMGTAYLPSVAPNPPRPEFHIIDVSNPALPFELGSYDISHNVNAIAVGGDYAYLATSDDTGEVWVLDISNPASPAFVSTFDAAGAEDGTSVHLVGTTLYFGRKQTPSSRPDFYILDVTTPTAISALGSKNLSMDPSIAQVNGIYVIAGFAFLATGDSNEEFQVLNISNPASIPSPIATYNFPEEAMGIDFENNIVYAAVRSNDSLRIIRPAQCADMLDNDNDSAIDVADAQCHADGDVNNPASYNPEDDDES